MLAYMPPEALDNRHRYGPSLDIFSFGHPGSQGRLRQESPRNCEMLGWQSSFQILAFFSSFRKASFPIFWGGGGGGGGGGNQQSVSSKVKKVDSLPSLLS